MWRKNSQSINKKKLLSFFFTKPSRICEVHSDLSSMKIFTVNRANHLISCLAAKRHVTRHTFEADKLHLTNVLYNLIDNAIKYCKTTPNIIIRTTDSNKHLLLEVEDNGIGISPEHQKRVFQKFFRVPTGNVHDVKGFGIGLNYVKSIIEAHKGNIKLESDLGKGCIFKIAIPFQ